MSDTYTEWLDKIADAPDDDAMWAAIGTKGPPEDRLARVQVRERLIAVFKDRGLSAPARAADSWLDTPPL